MTSYGHVTLRVIAVVAFAGTAALAVTLTRAPARPDQATLSSSVTGTACAPSGLEAWVGLATTGSPPGTGRRPQLAGATYNLEFTNVSSRACRLYGYPEVSAYADAQIGSAAVDDTAVRPQPVTLEPGATAHSVLRITGPASFQPTACGQVTVPELRVTLPDRARASFVPIRLAACSKKGQEFMSVQPIEPRPGIPGSTMP
ncbi:MAG TPA: DUF4232 domain-containing protein [Streptosporangiaceae bacterium]|nr:DUF4232 domain-containing protein [Streptosporangiaceae bacterium]